MSDHVIEWLNAYHDGELHGHRLHQVETHLAECETCRMELDALQGLSLMLREAPEPDFITGERFISNVNLLLPQKRVASPERQLLEIGWWLIPVGLLAAWIFIGTSALLGNLLSTADAFGVLDGTTSAWIASPAETTAEVTSTLGQFGVLSGNGLQWAEMTESLTRSAWPQIVLQVSVALLYLAWFAIWWTRHTHQAQDQLLEG
jgi:predicted anti-sigma-YlaC factor YlaD